MNFDVRRIVLYSLAILIPVLSSGMTGAAQRPAPYRLTLQDAIQKALQANLNVLEASTRVEEASSTRARRVSALMLPRVTAETYASAQNRDLRAFGMSMKGIPEVVGPFSNYDFRVYAQQSVVDLQNYHALKASERALDTDKMDERDARDLIVRVVAGLYLNAQSAAARAEAAQSRVTDSSTLLKLAKDKHDAGTATGVDVLRAQVQLANDRQALLIAENQT
jgi:outer membrane protein TolC